MEIFLGIVCVFSGFCSLLISFIPDYDKTLRSKVVNYGLVICAIILFGLSVLCFISPVKFYSYPAKEYRLSIKTTTIDNQTDTTYIITKK